MSEYVIGNEFTFYYGTTYSMNTAAKMTAHIFKAQQSKSVTLIKINIDADVGTSPTYRIGLQAVDGSNEPTGTWLGATNQGYDDIVLAVAGFRTATLNESVPLTAGTTYAVVIQYQSGTIDGSNYAKPRHAVMHEYPTGQPRNHSDNDINYVDANFRRKYSVNSGTDWSTSGCPVFLIEFSDATEQGSTYDVGFGIKLYLDIWESQLLTIDGTQTVRAIEWYIKRWGNPAGDLEYEIRGPDSESVLRSGTVAPAGTSEPQSYKWHRETLSSPLTLNNGAEYRLVIKSPSSVDTNNSWEVGYSGFDAGYGDETYGGTSSHGERSINGGSSWSSRTWDTHFRFDNTASYEKTFTIDAFLKASGLTKTFTANAWIGMSQFDKTFTADAILKGTYTKEFEADALLKASGLTKTFEVDAIILGGPAIVSPDGGSSESSPVYLVFTTVGTPVVGLKKHFLLELDKTSSAFADLELDLDSHQSQTNWQYWDGGAWQSLPAAGLDPAYYGNDVRYQATLTDSDKWWRVREKMRRDS